jgi:hypothetical protein
MSTNVDDYTVDELMSILGIDTLTEENVENACGEYIQRFQGSSNEEMVTFFQNIESKLLDQIELDNDNELENENENENDNQDVSNPVSTSENANDWFGSTYLQQNNKQQKDKITQRENKVQLFDNGHVPMNREQLGVTNNYQVKVGQDTLNPVLQNTISRYIVIDSQYRQSSSGDGYTLNTDFTLDLSEHMVNVLSIRLSAIQIPFSWFNINSSRSYFYIYNKEDDGSGVYQDEYYLIKIEEGNYDTIDDILTAINASFTTAGFVKTGTQNFIYLKNGLVFIDLYDTTINGKPLYYFDDIPLGSKSISGIFFYPLHEPETNVCTANKTQRTQFDYENTLGWLLGYRQVAEYIYTYGNPAQALYKLNVLNYIIVVIDDFNQNHINNGLVTITELSNRVPYNKYNTANNPYYCIRYDKTTNVFDPIKVLNISLLNAPLGVISEKIVPPYNDIVHVLPSAPRTLTQSQIYATNEIAKANAQTTRYKTSPPNNSDTFAIFPFSTKGALFGSIITETGSTLQLNQRVYFGPVNLDRLRVKILDDKGNLMDFNGIDWNIVIIADCLYQY